MTSCRRLTLTRTLTLTPTLTPTLRLLQEEDCTAELRRIVFSFRLESELNALAATRMFIERVRLAPLCFSAQYQAAR